MIVILILCFFACGIKIYGYHLSNDNQCIKEEIDRINNYFQKSLEVYKIPSWIERASLQSNVSELNYYLYLLQNESDKQRDVLSGIPYWPYSSRERALKIYNKLPEEERTKYMVISQSIVYIAYTGEEKKEVLETAKNYYDKYYKDI